MFDNKYHEKRRQEAYDVRKKTGKKLTHTTIWNRAQRIFKKSL